MIAGQFKAALPLLLLALLALLLALWGGLLRLGWPWPLLRPSLPLSHGPLMISGFFGTLIGLERAVAIRRRWAYLGPLFSGAGGLLVAAGLAQPWGPLLICAGALVLALVFAHILRAHFSGYTLVMALGALAWLGGSLLWLLGRPVFQVVLWWVGFLVLTIAGERLELGRLARLTPRSRQLFALAVALYLLGALAGLWRFDLGVRLAGGGMLALAAWLLRYDIARRTVRKPGLPRYIAMCLLSGYVWLGISGLIGLLAGGGELREFAPAGPLYDALLHGVLVGFVFGMIFGHAPIIFPAVLGLPVNFHPSLYAPLVLLNLSLALRLAGDLVAGIHVRQWGGLLNALAILLFLALLAGSRLRSRPD